MLHRIKLHNDEATFKFSLISKCFYNNGKQYVCIKCTNTPIAPNTLFLSKVEEWFSWSDWIVQHQLWELYLENRFMVAEL